MTFIDSNILFGSYGIFCPTGRVLWWPATPEQVQSSCSVHQQTEPGLTTGHSCCVSSVGVSSWQLVRAPCLCACTPRGSAGAAGPPAAAARGTLRPRSHRCERTPPRSWRPSPPPPWPWRQPPAARAPRTRSDPTCCRPRWWARPSRPAAPESPHGAVAPPRGSRARPPRTPGRRRRCVGCRAPAWPGRGSSRWCPGSPGASCRTLRCRTPAREAPPPCACTWARSGRGGNGGWARSYRPPPPRGTPAGPCWDALKEACWTDVCVTPKTPEFLSPAVAPAASSGLVFALSWVFIGRPPLLSTNKLPPLFPCLLPVKQDS